MRIAVIGSGVIGLTTAINLLKHGREVIIYSKDPNQESTNDTVSLVACALWQPYKLFKKIDEYSLEKYSSIKEISRISLNGFHKCLSEFGSFVSGIDVKNHYEYSVESIYQPTNGALKSDFYYVETLRDFWTQKGELDAILEEIEITSEIPFKASIDNDQQADFKYLHGYKTYAIDPSIFLGFLKNMCLKLGGKIVNRNLNLREIKKLKEKVIFNCTGINGHAITGYYNQSEGGRKLVGKRGVLMLYKLKDSSPFRNTIVLDELTILCRQNELTIGTGEIIDGEDPNVLIDRLKRNALTFSMLENVEKFGFDLFLQHNKIDIDSPDKILIGSRPHFPDGLGYSLEKETHYDSGKEGFIMYNNFGHGGSGVTLSWGCADHVTKMYLESVEGRLNLCNPNRLKRKTMPFSVEFSHLNLKHIANLNSEELFDLVLADKKVLAEYLRELEIPPEKMSLTILIDDKEASDGQNTLHKLISTVGRIGVDYVAVESRMINYIDRLKEILPIRISNEFSNYLHNHHKLGCAQDIFVWYCLRFGLIEFSFEDEVIIPVSDRAKSGTVGFCANSLISFLDSGVKFYEDKASEYVNKAFGYEIASSIKRFYVKH